MRIVDRIKSRETFTPTENTIVEYMIGHSREITEMSLEEVADTLYVSKSSIIRFCKKMGFRGYKELCVQLAKELDTFVYNNQQINPSFPYDKDDTAADLIGKTFTLKYGALTETFNNIDTEQIYRIAREFQDAGELYLYTGEESYLLAKDFEIKLTGLRFKVHLVSLPGMNIHQALLQEENTAAFFIFYDERQESFLNTVKILADKKIPIYFLSGPSRSPVRRYAKETIQVSYYEPYPKIAQIGSKTAMLMVLDCLYACLFQMNYDASMNTVRKSSEQLKKIDEHFQE